ncbi:MAG: glycosyltransferase [Myxococcales bacterium]|nr:glycosyltransferase [Myxococcales bacterium]
MTDELLARVDLHLHSHASNVTDYYAANAFAIPESYSDPKALYRLLRRRGMALVTLTDHNSIAGVRELLDAGLPDVFLSSELTATFPEDGCNIHITVANVSEAQFAEADRLRANVYELVAWLDAQIAAEHLQPAGNRLAYFMTHPLMSTQNRPYGREGSLTVAHLEKALLLCNCLEIQNGARTPALNGLTGELLRSLDRATLERLAERHRIAPKGDMPWRKAVVGGSDDHSGIHPGRTWTEFAYHGARPTADDLVLAIRRRETRPGGAHGGPVTLAHSLLKLIHDGHARRERSAAGPRLGGPAQSLLRIAFSDDDPPHTRLGLAVRALAHRWLRPLLPAREGRSFESILDDEILALLVDPEFRRKLAATDGTDDRIFLVVNTLVNRVFTRYTTNLRAALGRSWVGAIKQAVALLSSHLFVSLPYLVAFLSQSSDCRITRDVRKAFDLGEPRRLVLFTDTFFEINGVSTSIRRMLHEATRRGVDFTVVTCLSAAEIEARSRDPEVQRFLAAGRLKIFPSVVDLDFPEYDGLKIRIPPLLELLRYVQEAGFTKLQISTPGTVGLAGLLAAKTLQIESAATYHTSFPEYVEQYTRDVSLEALAWRYMLVFYHAVDEVLVPSQFIARLLHRRGLRNRKLLILDRWVDVDRFRPDLRTPGFWRRFGLEREDAVVKFAYVGRLGLEKNLHLIAEAFRLLHAAHPDVHLVVIGDGPYREALARGLAGLPVTFTGFLAGDDLARALASIDVKLFPSTTDTWGNAPLEAQASGVPVIVSDIGGPAELMRDGLTGLKVAGRDVHALHDAMERLLDPELRARMARDARAFAVANRVDAPFTAILDADAYRRRIAQERQAQAGGARIFELVPRQVDLDDPRSEVGA